MNRALSIFLTCKKCGLPRLGKGHCPHCNIARARVWISTHPGYERARGRRRRAQDPEKFKQQRKARYWAERDEAIAAAREWEVNHPDLARERKSKWRLENLAAMRQASRDWANAHPERIREQNSARRAKYRGRFTPEDVSAILERQKTRCVGCNALLGDAYHIDHVAPVSKGGSNTADNLQLLCRHCNLSKHDKDPYQWAAELGRLFV
jgi:uncharacterized Zn finger protein (UPF0148 family)